MGGKIKGIADIDMRGANMTLTTICPQEKNSESEVSFGLHTQCLYEFAQTKEWKHFCKALAEYQNG